MRSNHELPTWRVADVVQLVEHRERHNSTRDQQIFAQRRILDAKQDIEEVIMRRRQFLTTACCNW